MYSIIPLTCAWCHQHRPCAACWCQVDLCQDCTPKHLALCAYAKGQQFKTWTPPTPVNKKKASRIA